MKQSLFLVLATSASSSQSFLQNNKKLQEEYYMLTAAFIIKEFNYEPDNTVLFNEIITAYQKQYN